LARLGKDEQQQLFAKGDRLTKDLAETYKNGLQIESEEVQQMIHQHYKWICEFWTPNEEAYVGLGEMYIAYGKVGDPIKCHPSHHQMAIRAIRFMRFCIKWRANAPIGAMREGFMREYSQVIIATSTSMKYPVLDDPIFISCARV
jgi:hypothetical protein